MLMKAPPTLYVRAFSEDDAADICNLYGKESATSIAKRYGKTRNAIIGLWYRARAAGVITKPVREKSVVNSENAKTRRLRDAVQNTVKREALVLHEVAPSGQSPLKAAKKVTPRHAAWRASSEIICEPIGLHDEAIRSCHCRFIIGQGARGIATFCGAHVEEGRSWCPGHASIVFAPLSEAPVSIRRATS